MKNLSLLFFILAVFLVTPAWAEFVTGGSSGGGSSGVASINSIAGAFTFTGSGVSCTSTTCTFSGSGGSVSVTAGSNDIVINPTPGTGTFTVSGVNYIDAQGTQTPYTIVSGDMGKLLTHSKTTAVAAALPQSGSTGFAQAVSYNELNLNTGAVTVTPTTSTYNGLTSTILHQYGWIQPVSGADGNWYGIGFPGFGTITTNALTKYIDASGATTASSMVDNGTTIATSETITLNGTSSGAVTLTVPAAAGTGTVFELPSTNGTNGYVLQTNGSGITSWVANTAGSGTVAASTIGQVPVYTGSTTVTGGSTMTFASGVLTLGTASTTAGSIVLEGGTSGAVTLGVPSTAGTTTFNLPGSNGASGQFLQTDGSGNASWQTVSSSGTITLGTSTSATNPQISGDAASGLYSSAAHKIDVSLGGTQTVDIGTGVFNIISSGSGLAVGANGATNPALLVAVGSTAQVNGVTISGSITGVAPSIVASGSDTNIGMTINTKGTGALTIESAGSGTVTLTSTSGKTVVNGNTGGSDGIILELAGVPTESLVNGAASFTPPTSTSAATVRFLYTPAADTALTTAVVAPLINFGGSTAVTRTHANGNITGTQEDFVVQGTIDAFTSSASTLTGGANLTLFPKDCGAHGTCTTNYNLYIPTYAYTGTVTTAYAAWVAQPTGATTNWAMNIVGDIEFTGSPPTVTSCGGGSLGSGSTDHKGQITGISAATACTITFSQSLAPSPACSFTTSTGIAAGGIPSTTAVTTTMALFTGTLAYICF